jgi:hypothetical protein
MKIKRTIAIILIAVMLMTGVTVNADTSMGEKAMSIIKNQLEILRLQAKNVQSFVAIMEELIPLVLSELKDIKESDWFTENVALLYGMNIVQGDGLGNFLPNKEVTGSEYLKMVVVALDNKTYTAAAGQQWDKPYIDRALELGLVKAGEISDYRKPLNRYNMAKIIVRACDESFSNYEMYQSSISDYSKIPAEFKEYVLKAYSKGIITGYPDGTFGGTNTMKRSEATAVIARLIDPTQRKAPKLANDLLSVPLTSEAQIEIEGPQGENNPYNVDFQMLFMLVKPLEPQYADAQALLEKRFGKDNAKVKEIMDYIKSKQIREMELPQKRWIINNHTIRVWANPNSMHIDLTVWRVVK